MNNIKIKSMIAIINILLVIVMSLFMYDGYKCLSGFIANNASDGLTVLVMVTSYFLLPICYLYYFYAFYVKQNNRKVSLISSIVISIITIFNLIFLFKNINLYVSNNKLGVYEGLPSLVLTFPYDMIIANIVLLIVEIINIICFFKPINKFIEFKNTFKYYGYFKFKLYEYILLSILAILCFVFIGDFVNSFCAIENIIYDPKYIFLMLFVLLIPLTSLITLFVKPECIMQGKKSKIIYFSIVAAINVILVALLFIFEAIDPNFIVRVGKPLFVITFSISIPIEIIILLATAVITTAAAVVKMILSICSNKE